MPQANCPAGCYLTQGQGQEPRLNSSSCSAAVITVSVLALALGAGGLDSVHRGGSTPQQQQRSAVRFRTFSSSRPGAPATQRVITVTDGRDRRGGLSDTAMVFLSQFIVLPVAQRSAAPHACMHRSRAQDSYSSNKERRERRARSSTRREDELND